MLFHFKKSGRPWWTPWGNVPSIVPSVQQLLRSYVLKGWTKEWIYFLTWLQLSSIKKRKWSMSCAMNILNSVSSCTQDILTVALKSPVWESTVGALHCINPVPKIASNCCSKYNGRYISKTVSCSGTSQTNKRDIIFQRNSYEPHDFLKHKTCKCIRNYLTWSLFSTNKSSWNTTLPLIIDFIYLL